MTCRSRRWLNTFYERSNGTWTAFQTHGTVEEHFFFLALCRDTTPSIPGIELSRNYYLVQNLFCRGEILSCTCEVRLVFFDGNSRGHAEAFCAVTNKDRTGGGGEGRHLRTRYFQKMESNTLL